MKAAERKNTFGTINALMGELSKRSMRAALLRSHANDHGAPVQSNEQPLRLDSIPLPMEAPDACYYMDDDPYCSRLYDCTPSAQVGQMMVYC